MIAAASVNLISEVVIMETRGRAYRRYRRHLAIVHKKGLSRRLIGEDWFQVDGKYSKGHIGCGCGLCKPGKRFREPSWADERKSVEYDRDISDFEDGRY